MKLISVRIIIIITGRCLFRRIVQSSPLLGLPAFANHNYFDKKELFSLNIFKCHFQLTSLSKYVKRACDVQLFIPSASPWSKQFKTFSAATASSELPNPGILKIGESLFYDSLPSALNFTAGLWILVISSVLTGLSLSFLQLYRIFIKIT